jgi:hypothetical protein
MHVTFLSLDPIQVLYMFSNSIIFLSFLELVIACTTS